MRRFLALDGGREAQSSNRLKTGGSCMLPCAMVRIPAVHEGRMPLSQMKGAQNDDRTPVVAELV
jgi:hypothetical protein